MFRYDTLKEAKDKLTQLGKKGFNKFCPLTATKCNVKCVCFRCSEIKTVARSNMPCPPVYEVHDKHCGHSMLRGS